ncbi:MAG: N-acetylmuramic acid 6-phosphate etherase, partial [Anaerolineae bacterium]|nr:N-acetylmuramic acid 6-phosphate etherase [Anaerolineae bacterium]
TFNAAPDLIQGVIAGGEVALTHSLEGVEDDRQAARDDLRALHLSEQDVVLGIAASGRTPYVLSAVAYAQECGALTVGLACNQPASLLEAVDIAIGVPVGPEVLTGSTRMKAGTAQKMVLNMISTATMVKLGKVYGNLMVDVQVKNEKLAQRAARIIAQITGLNETDAASLLHRANNQVKVAIVMHKLGVTYDEAQEKLRAADGYLREVIGDSL